MFRNLVFLVACLCMALGASASDDSKLWNKYRAALIKIVKNEFPKLSEGLNMQQSTFHVVTSPEDANWHSNNLYSLNEGFAKYPIKMSPVFDYVSTTNDYSIPQLYRSMIMKCKNQQAFKAFNSANTISYPNRGVSKSYPWKETKQTLAQFVQSHKNKPNNAVHFVVEESSGQTTLKTPWETKVGPVVNSGSFVKEYNDNDDDDMLAVDTTDDDQFLFGRRRRTRYVRLPQQTKIIKSEKFKVDFQAKGIDGITINPGPWFDRNLIKSNKGKLGGFFGAHGKMPVIPKVVWVAQNPHVVVELSESEWHKFKNIWHKPNTLGMSIGGAFFRHKNFRKVALDDDLSDEDRAFYENEDNADQHADIVKFSVVEKDDDDVAANEDSGDSAEFTVVERDDDIADKAKFSVVERDDDEQEDGDDFSDILGVNSAMTEDNDKFLFRRRRRTVYLPPPPPKKVKEKIYRAEFTSTSPKPQIIGVTGEIMP